MIRLAIDSDLSFIIDLLESLWDENQSAFGNIHFDRPSAGKMVLGCIHRGIAVVSPSGAAGGFIVPFAWNNAVKLGYVAYWAFSRPSGVKVFKALCEGLKAHGATHIQCASHFPLNRAGRHYAKFGLQPSEVQYIGVFNDKGEP